MADPALMEEARAKLARFMAAEGMRNTRQRELIVDTFLSAGGHISLRELEQLVQARDARIGFATVYRTMKLLSKAEVAVEHRFNDGHTLYEIAEEDEHHDHLICEICDRIVEFEDDVIERQQAAVAARLGFLVTHHRHEIYGVCAQCRAQGRTAPES